jgi:PPOX class probable F420-dependent enzyme
LDEARERLPATRLDPKTIRLLKGKNFVFIATLRRDGSPHLTPTWVDTDGLHVIINTAIGRKKERNISRDPRVSLSLYDQSDPYDHISIDGRVVKQVKGREAEAHIDKMSFKYLGEKRYSAHRKDSPRVMLFIEPTRIYSR